jgi:phospholipase/carboxylesterase
MRVRPSPEKYNMPAMEKTIIVESGGPATASVIWLHGLGADGHDFEPVVAQLGEGLRQCVRFVFPHAPHRPVAINGNMVMRAWYDVTEAELTRRPDEDGIRASEQILCDLVEGEIDNGVSPARIVLAGFSQGGAIALHTGLRYPHALAGIMALSTYLPLHDAAKNEASDSNRKVPIFMAHGSQDPLIPLSSSQASRAYMTSLGYVVECHTYPMAHAVCGEEIRDIEDWLSRILLWSPAASGA